MEQSHSCLLPEIQSGASITRCKDSGDLIRPLRRRDWQCPKRRLPGISARNRGTRWGLATSLRPSSRRGGGGTLRPGRARGGVQPGWLPLVHQPRTDAIGDKIFVTLRDGNDVKRIIKRWSSHDKPMIGRFSPDGSRLATANEDATARIWSASDGSPLTSPIDHPALVSDVTFSPDGGWLCTGTRQGQARVWDASTGEPLGPWLRHDSRVLRVAFSIDKRNMM